MRSKVPFNDLSRLDESIFIDIIKRINLVVSSGSYVLGSEVQAFESEFASYLGCSEVVGVASGTDALILSLLAAGVEPGDVVMTSANSGSYTSVAARAIGAHPVFVDVSPKTLNMSIETLIQAVDCTRSGEITPKALVVTHMFGQLNPDIIEISNLAQKLGMILIEDCAQSVGASDGSNLAGTFGQLSTFSFFPTKNLGAMGDGGAVAGSDPFLLSKLRKLRQYGWSSKYSIDLPYGRNSRLDEIQAAILRVKLPHVPLWNETRRRIYTRYLECSGNLVKFYSIPDASFVGHLCPITVKGYNQQELANYFRANGIDTSVHFPTPDHLQKIDLVYRDLVPLPVTENSCLSLVTLPIFPELSEVDIQTVCDALKGLNS